MTSPMNAADQPTSVPLQVCIGGMDHKSTSELDVALSESRAMLPEYKKAGGTSHESYIRWIMIEPEQGKFDFAYFDKLLDEHGKLGVGWVPFLVAGMAYTLPNWFYHGPNDSGYVCLEHNMRSDIQSLWNPKLQPIIASVIHAFGEHYAKDDRIESVLLGCTGNYGETIYPASGLDWTQDLHGDYHTHGGWWCGDKDAVADFQQYVAREFDDPGRLNDEWGTTFTSMDQVRPRLPKDWPTTAARQMQTLWYQESMNRWAEFWMSEAKKVLPRKDVYLVVGGHAPNYQGMDLCAQVELAARHGCGIRITNEADDYAWNFAITRMAATPCRIYGTFLSIEPAGAVSEKGIAGRVFNCAVSGARSFHCYDPNIFGTPAIRQKWEECRPYLYSHQPLIDVAVFYPRRWMNVRGDSELIPMYKDFAGLRNACDYDYLDERLMTSSVVQPDAYKWLVLRDDFIEDQASKNALAVFQKRSPKTQIIRFKLGEASTTGSKEFLKSLSAKLHPQDDYAPGIYFSRLTDGSLMFLNTRAEEVDLSKTHPRMVGTSRKMGPYSLAQIMK